MGSASDEVLARIRRDALHQLTARQRQRSNLFVDACLYEPNIPLGPAFQKASCDRDSVVVFADHAPWANFGHACEYLIYDARDGQFYGKFDAQFPPHIEGEARTWKPFHQPGGPGTKQLYERLRDPLPQAEGAADAVAIERVHARSREGNRFAVLFAGMSDPRHLHGLELCYRVLTERYGLKRENIRVLHHQGTRATRMGANAEPWPGDGTPYKLTVHGSGTRAGFQQAIDHLISRDVTRDDLVFVFTSGHGGNHGDESYLCEGATNFGLEYSSSDFAEDLAQLPRHDTLVVLAQQCFGGGFIDPVRRQVNAESISITTASRQNEASYALRGDENWDSFSWHWFGAHLCAFPNGFDLEGTADINGNGLIEVHESFRFARDAPSANPDDSPQYYPPRRFVKAITLR